MNNLGYRERAKRHAYAARTILQNGIDADVRYAALDLRMAIEAVAYERMLSYRNEISEEKLKTWQPHRVIDIIAAIDPMTKFFVKIKAELVEGSGDFGELFSGTPLSNNLVKKHYHQLGSYLHTPTINQMENCSDHSLSKAITFCKLVLNDILENIDIQNWIFVNSFPVEFSCERNECKATIKRNASSLIFPQTDHEPEPLLIECFDCDASYAASANNDGSFRVVPQMSVLNCQHSNCEQEIQIWHADVRQEVRKNRQFQIRCTGCGGHSEVVLGLSPIKLIRIA